MNRSNFIKSFIALVASPLSLDALAKSSSEISNSYVNEKGFVLPYKKKLGCWFMIDGECFKDEKYMDWLINNKNSELMKRAKKAGIDLDKEFDVMVKKRSEFDSEMYLNDKTNIHVVFVTQKIYE